MGTVQVRITNKAEELAKKYGTSVSKGIIEMARRLETPTTFKADLTPASLKAIERIIDDTIRNMR